MGSSEERLCKIRNLSFVATNCGQLTQMYEIWTEKGRELAALKGRSFPSSKGSDSDDGEDHMGQSPSHIWAGSHWRHRVIHGGHESSRLCCTEKSNAGSSYRSPMKNLKVTLMGSCSCAKQSGCKPHSIRNSYCRKKKITLRNNHIKQEVAMEHWQQREFLHLKNCKIYSGRAERWIANLEITQVYSLCKLILWFHEAILFKSWQWLLNYCSNT